MSGVSLSLSDMSCSLSEDRCVHTPRKNAARAHPPLDTEPRFRFFSGHRRGRRGRRRPDGIGSTDHGRRAEDSGFATADGRREIIGALRNRKGVRQKRNFSPSFATLRAKRGYRHAHCALWCWWPHRARHPLLDSPPSRRPRCHAESEPGEPTGPPRALQLISLAAALGGVHGGDIRYI